LPSLIKEGVKTGPQSLTPPLKAITLKQINEVVLSKGARTAPHGQFAEDWKTAMTARMQCNG
jgi:hypothetical protein